MTAAFVILVGTVIVVVAGSSPLQALGGFGLVLLGVPVYEFCVSRGRLTRPSQGVEYDVD